MSIRISIKIALYIFIFFYTICAEEFKNLVWGGDFQYETGPMINLGSFEEYQIIPSNYSNWYEQFGGVIEIKRRWDTITTKAIDLSNSAPYTLCQNISLVKDKLLKLQYSLFCDFRMQKMNLSVTLNGLVISFLYIENPNTFASKVDYFRTSLSGVNTICFRQTHSVVPAFAGFFFMVFNGGLLDNISIIQQQIVLIQFQILINQMNSSLSMKSIDQFNPLYLEQLKKIYTITVKDDKINSYFYIADLKCICQILEPPFSFDPQQIRFLHSSEFSLNKMLSFEIKINSYNQFFFKLSNSQQQFVLVSYQILKQVTKVISSFATFMKVTFCSYFIMTLLNFSNLSLFYIFLNIEIVPQFTREIYHQLLQIHVQFGSFTKWLSRLFFEGRQILQSKAEKEYINEQVKTKRNNKRWFGTYDFSSLVIKNNAENFGLLILLIAKLWLFRGFLSLLSMKVRIKFGLFPCYLIIVTVEFISMTPQFVVSSAARAVCSVFSFLEKTQKIFQILTLFLCIFSPWGYYALTERRKIKKEIKGKFEKKRDQRVKIQHVQKSIHCVVRIKIKKDPARLENGNGTKSIKKKRSRNMIVRYYNKIQEMWILIAIPFLVYLDSPMLFLIFQGLVAVLKMVLEIGDTYKSRVRKGTCILISIVWVVHHCCFTFFYVLDKKNGLSWRKKNEEYQAQLKFVGILCICTVLIGYLLQLFKFLIALIYITKKLIKKLKKWVYCRKRDQIHPTDQTTTEKIKSYKKKVNELGRTKNVTIEADNVEVEKPNKLKFLKSIKEIEIQHYQKKKKQLLGKKGKEKIKKTKEDLFYCPKMF